MNAIHYFILKIPNKREPQQLSSNYLSDNEFNHFKKRYKDFTKEPNSFLVNDTIFLSDNPLKCRKDLLENDCLRKSEQSITKC